MLLRFHGFGGEEVGTAAGYAAIAFTVVRMVAAGRWHLGTLVVVAAVYNAMKQASNIDTHCAIAKMRASIVCEDACCKFASDIHLGDFLSLGHGEEMNHGRERKSILADAFEALLAALYLDAGKEETMRFLLPYVKKEAAVLKNGRTKDYKTLLQQIIQQKPGEMLEYVLVGESGPDHKKTFDTEARLNSNVIGRGTGSSKRESEQMAAYQALILFGVEEENG